MRVESDLGSGAGWTTHSEAESIPEPSPLEPLELASVENDIDPLAPLPDGPIVAVLDGLGADELPGSDGPDIAVGQEAST